MEEALPALGEAISALGRGDPATARAAMAEAADREDGLGAIADAMTLATDELESNGSISDGTWNALADACPAELRRLVEMWRQ